MQTIEICRVVYSCLKCNLIVGDSTALQECNENLQVIILSGASNIQKNTNVITSKNGIDFGSTYFGFHCIGCKVSLLIYMIIQTPRLTLSLFLVFKSPF